MLWLFSIAVPPWLHPYLAINRGMPDWLFQLHLLFWYRHVFSRGKRAGYSPFQLAGVENSFFQALSTTCLLIYLRLDR